jgi:hypothetical protein
VNGVINIGLNFGFKNILKNKTLILNVLDVGIFKGIFLINQMALFYQIKSLKKAPNSMILI